MAYHSSITNFCVGRVLISACLLNDVGIFGQHIFMRDSHLVKEQETVVKRIESKFRSNISNSDSRESLVSFKISNLHNEGVWAVTFAVYNQLCHNASVISTIVSRVD
jgi:hypothetical protein